MSGAFIIFIINYFPLRIMDPYIGDAFMHYHVKNDLKTKKSIDCLHYNRGEHH